MTGASRVPAWPAVQHLSFDVADPRVASAFYCEFLGFDDLATSNDIAELRVGETKFVLLRAATVPAPPATLHFGFRVASRAEVDEWGRRARKRGIGIDFGPGIADWGGYVLHFRDPDGYRSEIWADD